MRLILFIAASSVVFFMSPMTSMATEPKAVALQAIATLFVQHDLDRFKTFVDNDAVQGNFKPGSAIAKIDKQRPEKLKAIDLSQIIFFRAGDIARLSKLYPDDLWPRVESHIGERQGVLVKIALSGAMAERARAAGKDPNDIGMMTFVVSSQPEPKIVHIDDN